MGSVIRDWAMMAVCAAKTALAFLIAVPILRRISWKDFAGVPEAPINAGVALLCVGLPCLWVLQGWLLDKGGPAMRKRRLTAWALEMAGALAIWILPGYLMRQEDFHVGHGQEAVLGYYAVGALVFFAAQFHLIPYAVESAGPGEKQDVDATGMGRGVPGAQDSP